MSPLLRLRFMLWVLASMLMLPLLAQTNAVAATKTSKRTGAEDKQPSLRSAAAMVLDQETGQILFGKNSDTVVPIASITKLMTAMVVLDANLDLEQPIAISREDVDLEKGSRSRLAVGVELKRDELLLIALMASENRAASALGRNYPGGQPAFVQAMNNKAQSLGMQDTHFVDPTGLFSGNVSTAADLSKMVRAAYSYPRIRGYTTATKYQVNVGRRVVSYHNTNRLVQNESWQIGLSKTGYISEAGRCLVMQARLAARPVIIVLLDSWGKLSRIADANRVRKWLEAAPASSSIHKSASAFREEFAGG